MARHVFLTGASAGFGLEIAKLLCSRGEQVWGTARSTARLPTFQNFHPIELDLLQSEQINSSFLKAEEESGGIDVLINNAGSGIFGPLETLPIPDLREQFQLLVLGQIELIQAALPHLKKRQASLIINVTSLAVDFPMPFMATYSAAKAAFAQFSSCLRMELAGTSVRCVDVRPGDFNTSFHQATRRTEVPQNQTYEPSLSVAWHAVDHNMNTAPHPVLVAKAIAKILNQKNPPPVVAVGDLFQARIAPFLSKLAPNRSFIEKGIQKFYGLPDS